MDRGELLRFTNADFVIRKVGRARRRFRDLGETVLPYGLIHPPTSTKLHKFVLWPASARPAGVTVPGYNNYREFVQLSTSHPLAS